MKPICFLLFALLLVVATGCSLFQRADVEVCYTHPKYGEVCVKVGGKDFVAVDSLPPELQEKVKKQVEALKTQ